VRRDTADYRDSAAGVVVNLATGAARGGFATGDVLTGIESLRGSGFADTLTGNALANALAGAKGADVLRGAAGADMLCGGLGADTLTGGAGNDAFVYRSTASGGDRITDFGATAGNNDVIRLLATAFGDHATGALRAGEFQANAAGVATKAAIRIIYDTDDGRILYDADGSGAGRAVLLATVQDDATMTASDFLFF
jgi:Ca2+-binding RTX toxin-like protein